MDLTVDDHSVEDQPAVIDRNVSEDVHVAGFSIDLHHRNVCAEWNGRLRLGPDVVGAETGFHVVRQIARVRSDSRDLGERHSSGGDPGDADLAVIELDHVLHGGLGQVGDDGSCLLEHVLACPHHGRACHLH